MTRHLIPRLRLIVHADATAVRNIYHVDTRASDYSPAFGYRDTPSLDLTMAVPNSGTSPLPVPAGLLDVTLTYVASSSNSKCANASNTLTSAFLIQVAIPTNFSACLANSDRNKFIRAAPFL